MIIADCCGTEGGDWEGRFNAKGTISCLINCLLGYFWELLYMDFKELPCRRSLWLEPSSVHNA